MKTTKFITAVLLATLALAACNKDNETPEGGLRPGQVDIRTSIVGTPTVETRATLDPTDGSGTFDDDDMIMLVVYGSKPTGSVLEYSKNAPRTWEEIKTFVGESDTYTFCGWYTNPNVFPINGTTFNAATATDPDLLLAVPATVAEGATVNLPFRHVMHQLIINLTGNMADLGVTIEQFNATKVSLLNMNATAEVDVSTGTVTPGEAWEPDGDYGTKTDLYDFIIAPQKVATDTEWIKIELADMTFIYKVPATLNNGTPLNELESGKRLTLMLTLKKSPTGQTNVVLSGSTISAWGTQGTIDDSVDADDDTPPATSGDIDMTGKTVKQTKAAIQAALAAGFTDLKLTGPIANSGIKHMANALDDESTFFENTQITKIDLTEVTGWVAVEWDGNPQTIETEIGLPAYAFYGCENLTEVKLPKEVEAIGQLAFNGCKSLKSIDFENVTTIGYRAFILCTAAATINLPSATTIGSEAFYACSAVKEIELPEATTLFDFSFSKCTALTTLRLPKATKMDTYLVSGCGSLTRIEMTAAGNITDTAGGGLSSQFFGNGAADSKFDPKACTLVLNTDKQEGGTGKPLAQGNSWARKEFKQIEYK